MDASGFGISIAAGIMTAILVLLTQRCLSSLRVLWRYSKISGTYYGYGCKPNCFDLSDEPQSEAKISRRGLDTFKISLNHGKRLVDGRFSDDWMWEGLITMDSHARNIGVIWWEYKKAGNIDEDHILYGFKKCHVDRKKRRIDLVGDKVMGMKCCSLNLRRKIKSTSSFMSFTD